MSHHLYKAPRRSVILRQSIFLAGSIEMGKAENWQDKVWHSIHDASARVAMDIFNPRRDDWDSSWDQTIDNKQFVEQVEWELFHIKNSEAVFFYFDPTTKSPVTLMELGIVLATHEDYEHVVVVCPKEFYRRGNVEITAKFHAPEIIIHDNLQDGVDELLKYIRDKH